MYRSDLVDIMIRNRAQAAAQYWLTRTGGRVVMAAAPEYIEQAEAEIDAGILAGESALWLKGQLDNWARLIARWCDEIEERGGG